MGAPCTEAASTTCAIVAESGSPGGGGGCANASAAAGVSGLAFLTIFGFLVRIKGLMLDGFDADSGASGSA